MYSKSITRSNRALIVIAIDQSCSMMGMIDSATRTLSKAEMVAEVTNDLIAELIERSRRGDGVRDYYDVAIVGYSGEGVSSMIDPDSDWIPIVELDKAPKEEAIVEREYILPSGESRFLTQHQRRWVAAKAVGSTPMYEALLTIHQIVELWCAKDENRESFPPMIFNITDGESTDCDYSDIAEISSRIKSLSTYDGNALLINVHIASLPTQRSMLFPSFDEFLASGNYSPSSSALFHSSSDLPPIFMDAVCQIKGGERREAFKAVSYNCKVSELISIINIGSISVKRG